MKKARKLLSAMLGVALALAQVPASVATAAWMPDHQIPAYQQKDIFATDTVKIQGLTVSEVVNATVNPVITRSIDKEVKFVVFNSTKQVIEQEVTSKDGKLPDLNLVRNHNYIIWAEDSEYRMPNVYVWVKDGRLVLTFNDSPKASNSARRCVKSCLSSDDTTAIMVKNSSRTV